MEDVNLGTEKAETKSNGVENREQEQEETVDLPSYSGLMQQASVTESPLKKYYFGIRNWHPKWMQVLASAKFFTFILCLDGLVEGALVSGFSSVIVSTVERRYGFSSTAVGVLLVSFDLSVLLSVIFISYFGDKQHKPRCVGLGIILQGIGALVFSIPQFAFGSYRVGAEGALTLEACEASDNEIFTSICNDSNYGAYVLMLLGNILIGIGAAPLFTLGLSYVDDITLPKFVPIHIGVFYVSVAVGPAIGYGLGGAFLSVYVDPSVNTDLQESDPGWVGAWWLCFIFSGVLSLIISVPFFFYPRFLSNYPEVVEARKTQHVTSYESKYGEETSLKNQLKAFPIHLWDLFKSPSFVCVTFALSFLFLTLYGLVAFGPKFIESVFNIPASRASILAGAVAIPAGGLGTLVGSVITYVMKSDTKKVAIIPWITSLITLPPLLGFFITCPSLTLAGINAPYPNNNLSVGTDLVTASCNYDCMCNSTVFEPVCGPDGITNYFSPCRAGCIKSFRDNNTDMPLFESCTCIAEGLLSAQSSRNESPSFLSVLENSTATDGRCPLECNTLGLWLLLIGITVFLIFLLRIPTLLITIRSVAEEQRSLALGVQSVLWRALGSIPGPILFGVVFDSSCVYWQYDCGRRGNCWVYDNNTISLRAFFISFTGVLVNFVLMLLCWIFYPPITCKKRSSAESDEEKQEKNRNGVIPNPIFNLDPDEEKGKGQENATDGVITNIDGVITNPTLNLDPDEEKGKGQENATDGVITNIDGVITNPTLNLDPDEEKGKGQENTTDRVITNPTDPEDGKSN